MGYYTSGRHYALYFLAYNICWQMLLAYFRQILLPYFVADGIALFYVVDAVTTRQMLQPVLCMLADIIAIILFCGRCYCHS